MNPRASHTFRSSDANGHSKLNIGSVLAFGALLFLADPTLGVMITLPYRNPFADVIVTGPSSFYINEIKVDGDPVSLYWANFEWNENTLEFEVANYGQSGHVPSSSAPAMNNPTPPTPRPAFLSAGAQGVSIDLTKSTLEIADYTTLHISRIAAAGSSYHADFGWNEFRNTFQTTGYLEDRPISMNMILIPAGKFNMGAPPGEPHPAEEEPVHKVTLTKNFYLSATEVTQAQWDGVMNYNPSQFNRECGNNCAQDDISWNQAVAYCNALSAQEGLAPAYDINGPNVFWDPDADGYRLPTEAEWEYACRATTAGAFYSGAMTYPYFCAPEDPALDRIAWYCGNEGHAGKPLAKLVGQKNPNLFGLYDMSGNVQEWVWDHLGPYPSEEVFDPTGPSSGLTRILRGGSWDESPINLRSASRAYADPSSAWNRWGFRVARSME